VLAGATHGRHHEAVVAWCSVGQGLCC
jgi:hypothetical protein